jgi:hypothetical protein
MSTPPNPDNDESHFAHIARICKNSCTKCFGAVQTTDEYAKIKYKEYQIDSRKKQFGVDFLKLVHENATEEDKKACIDKALADTATIDKEIDTLRAEIERVKVATQQKIVPKPGTPAAAATTATTAPAAAAPAAPTPAPEPAVTPAPEPTPEPASAGVEVAAEDVNMQEVPLGEEKM